MYWTNTRPESTLEVRLLIGAVSRHVEAGEKAHMEGKVDRMEVIVYTKPGCDSSRRIKEILEDRGVEFQEHVCADGKVIRKDIYGLDVAAESVPLTVIDGVPISGMNRSQIEQAIGWIGF